MFNGVVSSAHCVASSIRVCYESQIGGDVDGSISDQIVGAVPQFAHRDRRRVQNVVVGFFGVCTKIRTQEI